MRFASLGSGSEGNALLVEGVEGAGCVLIDCGFGLREAERRLRALSRLDALVLECNHDLGLLEANRRYTAALKRRIAGQWGHLGNGEAARILASIDHTRLRTVVAAHLSRQNNRPELARAALAPVFDGDPSGLQVADQDNGIGWIAV